MASQASEKATFVYCGPTGARNRGRKKIAKAAEAFDLSGFSGRLAATNAALKRRTTRTNRIHLLRNRSKTNSAPAGLEFTQFAPPWQLDLLLVALYFSGASICSKWFSIRWNKCVRAAIPAMPCVLPGYTISWNCLPELINALTI